MKYAKSFQVYSNKRRIVQLKTWLIGMAIITLFAGCGPNIITTNNVPLRLAYQSKSPQARATNQEIILLKPTLRYSDNIAKEYANQFKKQIMLKIQAILNNRGYKTSILDVSDKDDLSFAQKKESYLGLELSGEVVLRPDPQNTEEKKSSPGLIFSTGMDVTKGVLLSMGNIKVVFIEPSSGEVIDSFMINLSELDIRQPFIRSSRSEHTGGLLGSLYKGKDDSNDAVKTSLNKIFAEVMQEIDTKITREKIRSYARDIADLKAQHKY
ncbi:HpaA family protein [Helicobacter suis]|uniref:HpaA family protein n=1 Tax=Helicobacter suis TaxID=104628 RepID=UPI0013D3D729